MRTRRTRRRDHRTHLLRSRPHRRRLLLEPLEPRRLLDTYSVTSLLDDGSVGTLRWAIALANADPGPDEIVFQEGLTGEIDLGYGSDPDGGNPDLDVTNPVTITGPGSRDLSIDGQQSSRIFHVASALPDSVTVNISQRYAIAVSIPQ